MFLTVIFILLMAPCSILTQRASDSAVSDDNGNNIQGGPIHEKNSPVSRQLLMTVFDKSYGEVFRKRERRALGPLYKLAKIGADAVQSVLQGTWGGKASGTRRVYYKSGGMPKLNKDFKNSGAENVQDFRLPNGVSGKAGRVGDRVFLLRSKGDEDLPVLEIYRAHDVNYRKEYGKKMSELDREEIRYTD